MSKKRILMLTCQYMPDVYGGAEKQCQKLVTALEQEHKDDFEIQILTSTQLPNRGGEEAGVKRFQTLLPPDLLGRYLLFSFLWLVQVLWYGYRHREKFDVIHVHQGKFGLFVGSLLGHIVQRPVMVKIGNAGEHFDLHALRRKKIVGPLMYNYIKSRQPHFIAITSAIAEQLKADGFTRIKVVPNGVSTAVSPSTSKSSDLDSIEFFYHGRIEPIKRLDKLVSAFARIAEAEERVTLTIYGDGSQLSAITQQVDSLPCSQRISLAGSIPNITNEIARHHIFVNTSDAEGFSNSLLEALTYGKVLVSTPVSGAIDAIKQEKNGYVTADFTVEAIEQAMTLALRLHRSNKDDVQTFNQKLVNDVFQINRIAAEYTTTYKELLNEPA